MVQPKTIIKEVNDVNNEVLKLIQAEDKTSVWANYRLAGVQAIPSSNESSQPGIQLFRGSNTGFGQPNFVNNRQDYNLTTKELTEGQPVPPTNESMGGCQGCHGLAQTTLGGDFSFLVLGAGGFGSIPDTEAPANATAAQLLESQTEAIQHRKAWFP